MENDIIKKSPATEVKIKYGNGLVSCDVNGEIAGFEIKYKGSVRAMSKLGNGWVLSVGENKIVIASVAQTPIGDTLFSYIGVLEILSCSYVTWDLKKKKAKILGAKEESWKNTSTLWDSLGTKPEELEFGKVVKKRIRKKIVRRK
jgi:hypothetical protein